MDITFLGTGSAFNHYFGNNSALLTFDNTNLLLDCGHSVPNYLEEKIKIGDVDNIWISHMHADHIGGLEEIAFKNKFMFDGKKTNLIVAEDIYDDLIFWLELTLKWTPKGNVDVSQYFNIHKIKGPSYAFSINNTKFSMKEVHHIGLMPAFMLVGDNFIFTGDTQFINWIQYNLNNIDYIFQDTQLKTYSNDVHATLDQLLTLPEDIRNKIYCMHYGIDINEMREKILASKMHIVKPYQIINLE